MNPYIHLIFHFFPTCTYTFTTLHLLHTFFRNPKTPPNHHSSLLKCLKNEEEKKEEKSQKKERIRSYKKENKWEYLLPLSLPPLSSPPSTQSITIHLTWEYNYHKWYLLCFYNPLCFISIFAFSQVIPLEILSFISFNLLTRCI